MADDSPIGFFDSGVGGTSIWGEVTSLLPAESTIYLADSANAPYGIKSREEIKRLAFKNTELLLEMGAKLVVVACNTATTVAINELRAKYDVPFIGIEPAIKPAALESRSGKVGVLATRGTLTSDLFKETSDRYRHNTEFIEVQGTGLVELIEAGKHRSPEAEALLKVILQPISESDVDYLVLGCSHYPYLIPLLRKLLPENVQIIDSGAAVAAQTQKRLKENELHTGSTSDPVHKFYTNSDPRFLKPFMADFAHVSIQQLDY